MNELDSVNPSKDVQTIVNNTIRYVKRLKKDKEYKGSKLDILFHNFTKNDFTKLYSKMFGGLTNIFFMQTFVDGSTLNQYKAKIYKIDEFRFKDSIKNLNKHDRIDFISNQCRQFLLSCDTKTIAVYLPFYYIREVETSLEYTEPSIVFFGEIVSNK